MDGRPQLTRRQRARPLIAAALTAAAACNVDPPAGRRGVSVEPGPCGRGLVVIASDYQSVNVALLDPQGRSLSRTFISSADQSPSLSAALGGDTVLPSARALGPELVLIDRYPNSVLTWVEFETARVTRQLSVATGFLANPHDYVAVSPGKAYVTRYEPNLDSGREPFDQGSDLLVIDPERPAITGRVDLSPALQGESSAFTPHPGRALLLDDRVYVLLAAYNLDYTDSAASRLAAIDPSTDELSGSLLLADLHGCGGLAPGPVPGTLAVSCSGKFSGSSLPDARHSGLSVIDVAGGLEERQRVGAAALDGRALAGGLDWIDAEHLLLTTFGNFAEQGVPARQDGLFALDLESGSVQLLLESAGVPFSLGDVRCDASCGVCYVADAGRNVVHRFVRADDGSLERVAQIALDDGIGLPPRYLGWF